MSKSKSKIKTKNAKASRDKVLKYRIFMSKKRYFNFTKSFIIE